MDCDRAAVRRRYDRLAGFIPLFDRPLFLPLNMRRRAVQHVRLRCGDRALEIGCGTGISLSYLPRAVGPDGSVYGVDLSPGMLHRAQARCTSQRNVDSMNAMPPTSSLPPLDGVLFSLSYNTMPNHRTVLRAWEALRPGGRIVIMDARLPMGISAKWLLPFGLWLMKHTMLGDPLIEPWKELGTLCEDLEMKHYLFGAYYICCSIKPLAPPAANDG